MRSANAMLEVETFPGYAPALPVQGMAAASLLSSRLARMKMSFDRLAARSAAEQSIQPSPDRFALWARMGDGSVLGLQHVEGVWQLTRVPVPPVAMRLLDLPDVIEARNELLWVEIAPNRVDLLRDGERWPLWQAEVASPTPRALPVPDLS
ncbi:MAG: hypothetical protein ABS95_00680 [Verrucomicrobia bacterium SCN 57-15]|nr:MAG: hypothetical protein ABS95_00680 [Verrucomicrobia bacterium SCN 57-15]